CLVISVPCQSLCFTLLSVLGVNLGPAGSFRLLDLRSPWLHSTCTCAPPILESSVDHQPCGLTGLPLSGPLRLPP
ncbi:hypothetical protein M9458_047216, partial [Cirrhinus mrigala]